MTESTIAMMPRPSAVGRLPTAFTRSTWVSPWLFAVPVVVFILRFLPTPFSDAAYGVTLLYSLTGRRQAVVALLMLSLLNMATHAFGMPPGLAAIYRHLVVAAAAFSAMVLHGGGVFRTRCPRILIGTSIVCLLILVHSAFLSQLPVLSLLKALSFSMTILTLLTGWAGLSESERRAGEAQVWGLFAGLTVLSTPMLFTPLGYLKQVGGFQGLTAQAQALGSMMGVFAAFLWISIITRRRLTIGLVLLACMATAYMFLSQARIGGFSFVVGLFSGLALSPLLSSFDRWRQQPRIRFGRLAVVAVLTGVGLIAAGSFVIPKLQNYIIKYGSAQDGVKYTDELYRARGGMVELMLRSVKEHPLTGIGFGVPTEGGNSTAVVYDPVFGLPIMATVEKGVMLVAVLEELGYPLATIVYLWLAWLFMLAARGGPVSLTNFSAALAVNAAENCFFSPGGFGLLILVIICMAVTAAPYESPDSRWWATLGSPRGGLPRTPAGHAAGRPHDRLLPGLLTRA
jgi:hypothetical protein